MDSRNIAICLAPTLLNMNSLKDMSPNNSCSHIGTSPVSPTITSQYSPSSSSTTTSTTTTNSSQLMSRQCNASLECLSLMIEMPQKVFLIPNEAYTKCQFTKNDQSIPMSLNEHLGSFSHSMLNIYFNDRIEKMCKELKEKSRSWSRFGSNNDIHTTVEVSYKVVDDEDSPLRLWKLSTELNASADVILNKLLRHRAQWDEDFSESRVIEALGLDTEIFQYVIDVMAPQPSREFCELRGWRDASHINSKYSVAIYCNSIEHEKVDKIGDIRANTVLNFYLIEKTNNTNKCKLHQIYRADYR